ncbi:MAG: hypothetical protein COC17_07720 [Hyphomicrobiales bacterium]|nr:DUF1178 family protein [Hyphomicrobiales bacterium]PCH49720.1 MAG: hypothetical protein COC17_07720 [Hyphomicrobiales bacterium]
MIKFALGCDNEHEFEGWFGSNDEFVRLQKRGLVDCPICNSTKIEKLLMAPAIPKKSNAVVLTQGQAASEKLEEKADISCIGMPSKAAAELTAQIEPLEKPSSTAVAVPELPPQLADAHFEMVEKIRAFKKHVIDNTEDVGKDFVEEARKIHFGEAEKRGIHGKADLAEAIELAEEGIDVVPIPELPEEKN